MGLSYRRFLLDRDDRLYRLPLAKLVRMFDDPAAHPLPRFAGQRVRSSEVIVELLDRVPQRVVWMTFGMFGFDHRGCLQPEEHARQQWARAELALAQLAPARASEGRIIDAANRFRARGGTWTPSSSLQRRIEEAALDCRAIERL
ncbi:MAG: hypothetical protein KDH15_09205 [Rhodocyclaceae bacterium]|nr:hypothetical protein [Rhodocyclaceae bacterium]